MKTLSIEQWRLFVQIADHGSLTHTAAARDVAQSAISRQLAAIEEACGGRLFERRGRGVRLSDAGTRMYPRVMAWLEDADQLMQGMKTAMREPIGIVRLGILSSITEAFSGSVYRRVRDEYPGVQLQIVSGTSGRLAQLLEAGALDIALLSRNTHERHAREVVVGSVGHVLVGAPGDVITGTPTIPFEQLNEIPLVVPSRPYAFHHLLEHWALRKNITLKVAAECDSLAVQKHLVRSSGLYAIMGASAVIEDVTSGRLQASRIVSPALNRKLVLQLSDAHPASTASKKVLTIMRICSSEVESPGF